MADTPPEATTHYDIVILGGGSGGYACALRAAQLGKRVALVEKDKLGGTCLHRGCIPTKALLHAAEVADSTRAGAKFGINATLDSIDLARVHSYKDGVVGRLYKGLQGLVSAATIEYVEGHGRLTSPTTVQVGDRTVTGRNVVLATGSYARTLPGLEIGGRVMTSDQAMTLAELPRRVAGWSACFRREAGSAGKDTRGVYRVHQFSKVEQVVVCRDDPEESRAHHMRLLGNAETLLRRLEIPYRVSLACTGEIGLGQVLKHEVESWMPSRKGYFETHSCSSLYDYQARRSQIRWRDEAGQIRTCFTLNNTMVASPRILIPLLENHQQEDGSVHIPEALRPYMNGIEKLVPR